MRILVVSDTHGNENSLRRALYEQPGTALVIHLGDGAREAGLIAGEIPQINLKQVCGNCDWGYSRLLPEIGLEMVQGRRIFYTHGHRYGVKLGLGRLVSAALERNADIVLFGHTHTPLIDNINGLHIVNPGSLTYKDTYATVDITPQGISANIKEIR
ncbi:MAG: metallophosphoesterase [Oscillospiraceae bacterium]|jgi:putative phosphoesterase|nr:metallophosphoesterase [Oscillospiraceae bacterium]